MGLCLFQTTPAQPHHIAGGSISSPEEFRTENIFVLFGRKSSCKNLHLVRE